MSWIRGQTIGHGSSAAVSVATCRQSGEVFAVKSVELSKSELLQREQRIFSTLNCPQIVEYKGCDVTWEENKAMFNVVMEFMPGGAVADAVKRGGGFDEAAVGRYTREIVQGLVYLHCIGVVHCDIKGRNILLGKSGAKIADFGCSKWVSDAGAAAIGGTPLFMAPEVAQGKEQGFPADIWALGCTVIEMATGGGSPWPNLTNPASLLYTIAFSGESPPIPNFLSDQAKDFLKNCLRRDPRERWTANQLLKHPFLQQFDTSGKQNQELETISPTSVLDQGIWSSSMAAQTSNSLNCPHRQLNWFLDGKLSIKNSLNSPMQRVRQLCSNPETMSDWSESSWITVRRRAEENIGDFSREQSCLLLGDSVSCCTSCTDSSTLRQKFVGNGQTLRHQKERVVNQLQLFYIFLFLLLFSFHFIPSPI
ncbi:PREDICTED: mitogen-activated protein kinase kinase kinase A-like [Ipomoea nil]|uniref:mitogen-activated protein kinase kinase kinase A-like n=1 Tax=Ipomoea nil TaxID=35883 RepID=UPI000900B32F|nr:PREDICTED: mitogen-activated protein kinase kinase kinase A-like [Ipomoea nil]